MADKKSKSISMNDVQRIAYLVMMAFSTEFRKELRCNPAKALKRIGVRVPKSTKINKSKTMISKKAARKFLENYIKLSEVSPAVAFDDEIPRKKGMSCEPVPR